MSRFAATILATALASAGCATMAIANDQPLVCFGNEPSWSVQLLEPGDAQFATPDSKPVEYRGAATRAEHLRETLWRGADAAGRDLVVWLQDAACSDGMSDTQHPVVARVSLPDGRFLAGCCRVATPTTAGPANTSLEGSTWLLTELSGLEASWRERLERPVTVRFVDGQVSGFSSCNTFSGSYELDDDRLVVGQLASTMMACPEPASSVERSFQAAFAGTLRYSLDGDSLRLVSASGHSLLLVPEPQPRLDGVTWTVTSYNNGRQAVVGVTENGTITMRFGEGEISGNAGCNTFRARYTTTDSSIAFDPVITTRRSCDEPLMTQERDFLAALVSSVTWRIDAGVLDMHRADSERTIWAVHP